MKPKVLFRIVGAAAALVFNASCASTSKYDRGYAYPYSATAVDVSFIALAAVCYQPTGPDSFDFLFKPWWIPLYVADLPFSLLTDTVMLPYDLIHIRRVGEPRPQSTRELPDD
ncbi:YceK/YidQ family lipoprotein [Sulfuriroseicoccus oceanibius]|uniref:YceK/YidQ family lipoprotein n=1 Tax=Sulfuriroseicoccus oceanibius TaxID=2707525 RepID=A0A6B3LA68_9BACT|nr:YceK/YidQ family lipoprotein [Sulfuriroseicoccus oceanibius]QQL45339.1 YceK/YidQ family lipoprotein [Sulfuriroseicoccus oceanibius]